MNLLTLIESSQHTLRLVPSSQRELFVFEIRQHISAIIHNEIERKKGMLREIVRGTDELEKQYWDIGYNTAIIEDIDYLENVLQELEKNL